MENLACTMLNIPFNTLKNLKVRQCCTGQKQRIISVANGAGKPEPIMDFNGS
jgi:hypothetical protein